MLKQQQNVAAIYCRLSRDDGGDAESNSIGNQREMLRRYANENNLIIFNEYVDDGISGTTFERDSFKRMINDVEEGKIGVVLCKDLSRLGRNNALVAYYTELFFPDRDVRFIAVNDGIDSAKGENEIMGFKSIINEYYARDISKKIRSSMRTIAQKGHFIGGHAPYGYKLDPADRHHLLPDEETAPVVSQMFRWAAEGISANKIMDMLSDRHILTPRAYVAKTQGRYKNSYNHEFPAVWNLSTVLWILRNPEYCGHIISQKQTTKSFKNSKVVWRPKDEWVTVKNMHEPLVDEQTFEKVQSFIKTKRRENKYNADNIFAGMLKCYDCGYGLAYNSPCEGRRIGQYSCNLYKQRRRNATCTSHSISFSVLYEAVLTKVQNMLAFIQECESDYEAFYNNLLEEGANLNAQQYHRDLEKVLRRITELDTIMKSLYEDRARKIIPEDRFVTLFAGYDVEQRELKVQADGLKNQLSRESDNITNAGHFLRAISQFKEITELTPTLLHELIEKIVIHESNGRRGNNRVQRIDIHWRFVGLLPEDTEQL